MSFSVVPNFYIFKYIEYHLIFGYKLITINFSVLEKKGAQLHATVPFLLTSPGNDFIRINHVCKFFYCRIEHLCQNEIAIPVMVLIAILQRQ
jgi:hypothetical protein